MEWSLVLADLESRVRQEVLAMTDTIAILKQALETTVGERDEARGVARRYHEWLRRVAQALGDQSTLRVLASERGATDWLQEPALPKEKKNAEGREE